MATGNHSYITSTDLVTWTRHTFSIGGAAQQVYGIAALGSTFVATVGTSIASFDGTSWHTRFTGTGGWNAVAASASGFIAVGSNGAVATSPDGITWTQRAGIDTSPGAAGGNLTGVTYGAGGWVTIGTGNRGPVLYSSSNGATWKWHPIPAGTTTLESIAFGADRYVVTGRDTSRNYTTATAFASGVYTSPLAGGTTVLTNPTPVVVPTAPATALPRKP